MTRTESASVCAYVSGRDNLGQGELEQLIVTRGRQAACKRTPMDILKYLDILIGLAVVMVLLSPVVTSVTQVVMWARNKRSLFLYDGLKDLILHLDGRPAAYLEAAAAGVAGGPIRVAGPLDGLPGDAPIFLGRGIDAQAATNSVLAFTCTTGAAAAAGCTLKVTFIPQKTMKPVSIVGTSDTDGKVTIEYRGGAPGLASDTADVRVTDAAGQPVAAELRCTVGDKSLNLSAPGGTGQFAYPRSAQESAPDRYTIGCVISANGQPLQNHAVTFTFLRNTRFDMSVAATADAAGVATIRLPPQPPLMTPRLAGALAGAVLCHPMISKGETHKWLQWVPAWLLPPLNDRRGDVVEREELIRVLLELASSEGAGALNLSCDDRDVFQRVLWANGIPAPGAALSAIRTEALVLERDQPSEAACVRQAKAIINAAQSDFVGKINNWFDQTMSRVTQRYGAYARFITVLSAAIVAFSLQFDSLELLRRLSVDSSLRASLVDEARVQQTRVEALTTQKKEADDAAAKTEAEKSRQKTAVESSDELAAAKSKRDEIDATLVKLRAPSLAILPDHLLWQPVPEARLPRNPLWTHQYPQRYELIAGGGSYPVTPRWQEEFFKDLKVAIDASGAPVRTSIESNGVDVVFIAAQPAQVRVCAAGEKDEKGTCTDNMARGFREVAEASLAFNGTWRAREPGTAIVLAIDDEKPVPVVLECTETDPPKALASLAAAVARAVPKPKLFARVENNRLTITAGDPGVRTIRLLWNANDPFSNVLTTRARVPSAWIVKASDLNRAVNKSLTVTMSPGPAKGVEIPVKVWTNQAGTGPRTVNAENLVDYINAHLCETKITVAAHHDDTLLLRATRLGPIQLRYDAKDPKTNVLNAETSVPWHTMAALLQPNLLGVIVSWALLSLGAPFWYDMLKNLLKLRPAPAAAEEKQREDRAKESKASEKKA